MTPFTAQIATFKENGCPYAWTIMVAASLNVKNYPGQNIHSIVGLKRLIKRLTHN
jgi:hypothetical protein